MTAQHGSQHSAAFRAAATAPGPNGRLFLDWRADALMPAVPAGPTAIMYDGITASAVPQGAYVAGYFNGTFANLAAMRAGHPGATVVSITPDGARGAQFIDVEPGDATAAAIPAFLAAGGTGFYTSASQLAAAIAACARAGIARSSYSAWSAHWTGQHVCGPASCGYPQADGTQFASNASYDTSLVMTATFLGAPVTWPLREGSSGALVAALQADLNRWAPATGLAPPLAADGRYGPLTAAAVMLAQRHLGQQPDGVTSQALWNLLQGPVEAGGWAGMSATPYLTASFSWPPQPGASGYQLEAGPAAGGATVAHPVTGTHAAGVVLGPPGGYRWRVVPAGGAASPWHGVAG
jgi:peptidoglycan hydrolase-like protein with peptidoglycan-binding domain